MYHPTHSSHLTQANCLSTETYILSVKSISRGRCIYGRVGLRTRGDETCASIVLELLALFCFNQNVALVRGYHLPRLDFLATIKTAAHQTLHTKEKQHELYSLCSLSHSLPFRNQNQKRGTGWSESARGDCDALDLHVQRLGPTDPVSVVLVVQHSIAARLGSCHYVAVERLCTGSQDDVSGSG